MKKLFSVLGFFSVFSLSAVAAPAVSDTTVAPDFSGSVSSESSSFLDYYGWILLLIFLFHAVLCIAVAILAKNKNVSWKHAFLWAFFATPICGLLFVIIHILAERKHSLDN